MGKNLNKHAFICPSAPGDCRCLWLCSERRLCMLAREAPIDAMAREHAPALHFVGFRGEEYHNAIKVFGLPDFYHRGWDRRAQREIAEGDTVVFANFHGLGAPSPYSYDDSNEDNDPAARERRR